MFGVKKSEEQLIKEMHNEFDTAPDRLLQEALNIMNIASGAKVETESEVISKARRLYKLGFVNTELVTKMTDITHRNKEQDKIIEQEVEKAALIKKYNEIYPNCKFLTIEELNRICKKYGLVYAQVKHYTKTVPTENLEEIEKNTPHLGDWAKPEVIHYVHWKLKESDYGNYLNNKNVKNWENPLVVKEKRETQYNTWDISAMLRSKYNPSDEFAIDKSGCSVDVADNSGLFIAAPKKHFNTKDLSFDGEHGLFSLKKMNVIKTDPVVFKFVKDGVLIITKWGLVSEDPLLKM